MEELQEVHPREEIQKSPEPSIVDLKTRYGVLYSIQFKDVAIVGEVSFIFRPLSISEYKHYKTILLTRPHTINLIEDEVIKKCVVRAIVPDLSIFPENYVAKITENSPSFYTVGVDIYDLLPAGIVSSLFNAISFLSYPQKIYDWNVALEVERQRQESDIEYKLKGFICMVFNYKPEELNSMSYRSLVEKAVMAENASMHRLELPIRVVDKSEVENKKSKSSVFKNIEQDAENMRRTTGGMRDEDTELQKKMEQVLNRTDPKSKFDSQNKSSKKVNR